MPSLCCNINADVVLAISGGTTEGLTSTLPDVHDNTVRIWLLMQLCQMWLPVQHFLFGYRIRGTTTVSIASKISMSLLQVCNVKGNVDWFLGKLGHSPLQRRVSQYFSGTFATVGSLWPPVASRNCLLDIFDFLEDALILNSIPFSQLVGVSGLCCNPVVRITGPCQPLLCYILRVSTTARGYSDA